MRIGIDTCGCDHARSGVGSYLLYFVSSLHNSKDYQFELFGAEEDRFTYTSGKDIPFSSIPANNLKKQIRWHKTLGAKFIAKNEYDAVIYPAPEKIPPCKSKVFSAAVVNSLVSTNSDGKLKKNLKKNLKNVNIIITGSKIIKEDLIHNGFDESKIRVIYNGIDHKNFYPVLDLDDDILDIKPFAIKRPYFIYCTTLSGPDKKHIELIKAFEKFKEKNKTEHRLVIAGKDGEYSEKIHKAAFDSPYAEDIIVTGFFPFESLAKLYAGSDACIFPAINEGVGFPVLEAMACGVPVLCSSSGSLPEMGGIFPLYFDSENIDQIADAMEKIVSDKELRQKIINDGIERSGKFNWETTVAETLSVLK